MSIFKSMEAVRIKMSLGTHTVHFVDIEEIPQTKPDQQPAANIVLYDPATNRTYKDYRSAQSLGFAFNEMETQLRLGIDDPEEWYAAAMALPIAQRTVIVQVVNEWNDKAGRLFENTHYLRPAQPTDALNQTQLNPPTSQPTTTRRPRPADAN